MIINFPAYRNFKKSRIESNDAMIALLIGSRLAGKYLQTKKGRNARLPEIYEDIAGIKKLDIRVSAALKVLKNAEKHHAHMALPYTLSIYADFLVFLAKMLNENGFKPKTIEIPFDLSKLSIEVAHEYISECCNQKFDPYYLETFHLTRRIRNRIIHYGGDAGSNLEYHIMSLKAKELWERYSRRPLTEAVIENEIRLRDSEVIASLAICNHLSREAVSMVVGTIKDKQYWTKIVVEDFMTAYPESYNQKDKLLGSLLGYTQKMYKPLELTEEDFTQYISSTDL